MKTNHATSGILAALGFLTMALPAQAQVSLPKVVRQWRFNVPGNTQGWTGNGQVQNLDAREDGLHFDTVGTDPILIAPNFSAFDASDLQYVEIDIACSVAGGGELYYTNKTEGRYGGFETHWMTPVGVPASTMPNRMQTVYVFPFWGSLEKIVK